MVRSILRMVTIQSYREKRLLNRSLMEAFTKRAVQMQLRMERQQKKLDQKYGKNRPKQGKYIVLD